MIKGGAGGCIRRSKQLVSDSNNEHEDRMRTWRKSRFIRSRIFPFIPPDVILARHRSLTTVCMSAPCVIISSIEAIWVDTLYDARRSRYGLASVERRGNDQILCWISRDRLNSAVRVSGTSISERRVSRVPHQVTVSRGSGKCSRKPNDWCSFCNPPNFPTKSFSCATVLA